MSIRHIVVWRLTETDEAVKAGQIAEAVTRFRALAEEVTTVRSLEVGANVAYPEKNWDLGLAMVFDDEEGLRAYQEHPSHEELAAFVRSIVRDRASIDLAL